MINSVQFLLLPYHMTRVGGFQDSQKTRRDLINAIIKYSIYQEEGEGWWG